MILSFLFPSLAITSSLHDVKEEEPKRPALLGLYFASSWCPDCTPVSPKLKLLHEHHVKQLQKVEEQKEKEGEKGSSDHDDDVVFPMDLIYISSDTTEEQYQSVLEVMNGSTSKTSTDSDDDDDDTDNDEDNSSPNSDKNSNKIWNYASLLPPTEQITKDEIATIKRYFGVCAMKEMGELGMEGFDRKFGIPTLIWIKMCPEQGDEVVSVTGVQEMEELGVDGAWKKWQGLLL